MDCDRLDVTFEDIAGMEDVKRSLQEIISEPLDFPPDLYPVSARGRNRKGGYVFRHDTERRRTDGRTLLLRRVLFVFFTPGCHGRAPRGLLFVAFFVDLYAKSSISSGGGVGGGAC